ncbi:MAG: J domain-containing protein [Bacteroidota bacterium]
MLDSIPLSAIAGIVISAALVGSALLGWLADLKRVGASTSARETRNSSARPAKAQRFSSWTASGASPKAARQRAQEQEDRIREAYFAKERKARAARERQRRQQQARHAQARQRARQAAGGAGGSQTPPPPRTSSESTYRATLELKGPVTPESLRAAYRRLIAAYHPDRCATLGVKLQRLAEEETKRINEAYAYFRRQLK